MLSKKKLFKMAVDLCIKNRVEHNYKEADGKVVATQLLMVLYKEGLITKDDIIDGMKLIPTHIHTHRKV
jgi:hypothetical protein